MILDGSTNKDHENQKYIQLNIRSRKLKRVHLSTPLLDVNKNWENPHPQAHPMWTTLSGNSTNPDILVTLSSMVALNPHE
jgi:hypothetical protein